MSPATNRKLEFTPEEMGRIRNAARSLGTSYVEFIRVATLQAADEVEGACREYRQLADKSLGIGDRLSKGRYSVQ